MKLFSIASTFTALSIAACCCNGPSARFTSALAAEKTVLAETVEKTLFIKGMTCSGCVFGVKSALERAGISKDQIVEVDYKTPDPENKIGHAKFKFSASQYKGTETDCRIIQEIKKNPGYVAYWDASNTNPCNLK